MLWLLSFGKTLIVPVRRRSNFWHCKYVSSASDVLHCTVSEWKREPITRAQRSYHEVAVPVCCGCSQTCVGTVRVQWYVLVRYLVPAGPFKQRSIVCTVESVTATTLSSLREHHEPAVESYERRPDNPLSVRELLNGSLSQHIHQPLMSTGAHERWRVHLVTCWGFGIRRLVEALYSLQASL